MCLAIVNQPNSFLTKAQLKNAWDNNSDGAGIAYVDNGKVMTYHEGYNFEDFFEEYEFIRELTDTPILIHFRIATHGKGKDMLHPHSVTEGRISLIHNGVISGLGDHKVSDTREFANMLSKFYPDNIDFLDHAGIEALVMTIIGRSNKVAFLDWRGEVRILNEHLGHIDADGNWFSNTSYQRVNNYVWAGNKKVYKSGNYAKHVPSQPTIWDSTRNVAIPAAPTSAIDFEDDFDDEPSYKWNASKHELRSEYLRGTLDEDGIW